MVEQKENKAIAGSTFGSERREYGPLSILKPG